MTGHKFLANRQTLRWKLTLSYTGVTVGALLTVELILIGALVVALVVLLNRGYLPAQLIEAASTDWVPSLRHYLDQDPPDRAGITAWLERMGTAASADIPLSFDATDEILVVGSDGSLLGVRPVDLLPAHPLGSALDFNIIPGMGEPLRAALAGDENVNHLYNLAAPNDRIVITVPVWNLEHDRVLGALVAIAPRPTVATLLADILTILGLSLLAFTGIAGMAGTLYGFWAAREPVRRLSALAEIVRAWSQADFGRYADDSAADELGLLTSDLNEMARQLQQLMKTRHELAIVQERSRLARDLHDSAKQQAFAIAAQLDAAQALLLHNPAASGEHIKEAANLVDDLRLELTALIQQLRPVELQNHGLVAALRNYGERWARQNRIPVDLCLEEERPLAIEVEQAMYRILQEALANIARHSGAARVEIRLAWEDDQIILSVKDDGVGFDPEVNSLGLGLRSIYDRVAELGGAVSVTSAPDQGTSIVCTVPVRAGAQEG